MSTLNQTDTASVLSEAIEYIKVLHDQVHVSLLRSLLHAITLVVTSHGEEIKIHMRQAERKSTNSKTNSVKNHYLDTRCVVVYVLLMSSRFKIQAY